MHHAVRARFCIERGRWWQAEYWISGVRDQALALACHRRGLAVAHGRGLRRPASGRARPVRRHAGALAAAGGAPSRAASAVSGSPRIGRGRRAGRARRGSARASSPTPRTRPGARRRRAAPRPPPPSSRRERARRVARLLEQLAVLRDPREAEVGEPRLARAEERAAAADLEILLGELEAVRRRRPAPRAGRARSRSAPPSGRRSSRQYDCSAPRPTRPRSWCSWARPKRSASWTIMIVAFGTSTPTSITVVATSTSSSRALKRAISSRRSAGFSRPCMQPTRKPFSSPARSALGLLLGRAGRGRRRLLDQRADDVRLPALREVRSQARVRLGAALVGHPGRHDRLAARRRLRDLAHGEVAVDRERERARDRRRGHVEHVRGAPLRQRRALLDAEAVLLVDDGDGEVAELERPSGSAHACRRRRRPAPPIFDFDRAGHERAADAELGADALDRQEVLLGERLGRRHQRALAPDLDRPQERVERDDRLAGAHVALEQPLHRRRPREVARRSPRSPASWCSVSSNGSTAR